jgi:hypothetical protein
MIKAGGRHDWGAVAGVWGGLGREASDAHTPPDAAGTTREVAGESN